MDLSGKPATWQMCLEFHGHRVHSMDDKRTPFDELAVALSRKRALKLIGASVLAVFLPDVAEARKKHHRRRKKPSPPKSSPPKETCLPYGTPCDPAGPPCCGNFSICLAVIPCSPPICTC